MKKKIFTLFLALVAAAGFSWAETTVTWDSNTLSSINIRNGESFTEGDVTVTVLDGKIAGTSKWTGNSVEASFKFSTSLGNFTKIEITAEIRGLGGSGWTQASPGAVWTGDANETIYGMYFKNVSQIVFTIGDAATAVTGVTLSQSEAAMTVGGDALTLTATVAPDDATDKTVTWTSSDPTVATVADGVVTAVAAGTATITATATNGNDDTADDKTATCTVTVTEPASLVPVTLPDGAEIQQWYAAGTDNGESANVAWVGNDVYISGIFANFPDAWIKGTLGEDGSTVTFPKLQYLGEYTTLHIWAVAANQNSELLDIIMHYENTADGKTLTLDADQILFLNGAEDRVYYFKYFEKVKLMENAPAPKQIDELPYLNTFDSEEEQADFKIIDANNDNKTWTAYSGMMRYSYSSTNAGDDWLVSPMIKLKAGKVYKISLYTHAQRNGYPEKLEVKAAKDATASGAETAALLAAGTDVIAATTITTVGFISLSNDTFTVAETGYYNFGIHAISDPDKYYLYVDDFVVERIVTPDQEAAEAVEALFDALPAADAVTLNDTTAIEAARAAYETLTDEQKALVTAEELAKLTDAEAALAAAEKAAADQKAANDVVALFDALPADITLEDKAAIEAARAAYDALTADQKALVSAEDLAKLTAAEEALAAAEKSAADQEAAGAVVALFDALPADITLEDKAAIEAARAAYNALTDEQKALVTPEDLAKLTDAEAALAALKETTEIEDIQGGIKNTKIIENGQIYILRGDKTYTVTGQELK
ncbi:MAG: Ig domain-containing protein [Paludibacteraceae bacterium]|nr:Ig domain-containing protein [Paludibacteraceae bacterium]